MAQEILKEENFTELNGKADNLKVGSVNSTFWVSDALTKKTAFMEEFEQGISIEESRKKVYAKIDQLWSK